MYLYFAVPVKGELRFFLLHFDSTQNFWSFLTTSHNQIIIIAFFHIKNELLMG